MLNVNIVQTDNFCCDRAPGGELQMVLDRDEVPEERQVARLLRQILDGIAFLHSLNVAHLDIKVSFSNVRTRS